MKTSSINVAGTVHSTSKLTNSTLKTLVQIYGFRVPPGCTSVGIN